jgi:hypothetical protein
MGGGRRKTAVIEISVPTQQILQTIQTTQGPGEAVVPVKITGASLDRGVVRYQTWMDGQERILEDKVEAVLAFLNVTSGRIVDVSFDPAGLVSFALA